MKIGGQATLDSAPEMIWPLIFDPRTLLELLPGCDGIEQDGPDEYRARLNLRLPALAGAYNTHVHLQEHEAPRYCRLQGDASGPAGNLRGTASFTLSPAEAGTLIVYEGEAQISGPLAGMNPRFAEGVAQNFIRQGLARLPELARERAAAAAASELAVVPATRPQYGLRLPALLAALWAGIRAWLRLR